MKSSVQFYLHPVVHLSPASGYQEYNCVKSMRYGLDRVLVLKLARGSHPKTVETVGLLRSGPPLTCCRQIFSPMVLETNFNRPN